MEIPVPARDQPRGHERQPSPRQDRYPCRYANDRDGAGGGIQAEGKWMMEDGGWLMGMSVKIYVTLGSNSAASLNLRAVRAKPRADSPNVRSVLPEPRALLARPRVVLPEVSSV